MKEEVTRKLDSKIKGLSEAEVDALIKLSGNSMVSEESKEIKKNFLRELGLQLMFDIPAVGYGVSIGSIGGPIGMFLGGGIGALVGAFAGTAAERIIAGDPNLLPNAYTDIKKEALLTFLTYAAGGAVAKGGKVIKGL
ncbi:MAG: hypothetical protein ACR5K6_02290 [Wolbachia sp.]